MSLVDRDGLQPPRQATRERRRLQGAVLCSVHPPYGDVPPLGVQAPDFMVVRDRPAAAPHV